MASCLDCDSLDPSWPVLSSVFLVLLFTSRDLCIVSLCLCLKFHLVDVSQKEVSDSDD